LITMSDASHAAKSLRERLGGHTEDRLGRALSDLLDNPLLTGAIGRAFDAREKATQAQEVAMGALNIPSAADMERLTRRLRSLSQRLEGIEDGVGRLDRALAPSGVEARLSAIEAQLGTLLHRLDQGSTGKPSPGASPAAASKPASAGAKAAADRKPAPARGKRAAASKRSSAPKRKGA
jgi:hypothetical protein